MKPISCLQNGIQIWNIYHPVIGIKSWQDEDTHFFCSLHCGIQFHSEFPEESVHNPARPHSAVYEQHMGTYFWDGFQWHSNKSFKFKNSLDFQTIGHLRFNKSIFINFRRLETKWMLATRTKTRPVFVGFFFFLFLLSVHIVHKCYVPYFFLGVCIHKLISLYKTHTLQVFMQISSKATNCTELKLWSFYTVYARFQCEK